MKKSLYTLGILFVLWLLWATFSTSGLYKLKQINPDYSQENKNIAFLLTKYNSSRIEACSIYMPNWVKAKRCVEIRSACEKKYHGEKNPLKEKSDIASTKIKNCISYNEPSYGPVEMLHLSRMLWRGTVGLTILYITDGFKHQINGHVKNDKATKVWEKKNNWWMKPLVEWFEESE